MSGKGFIAAKKDGKCELCGVIDELRPYGPNGERICYDCGMKDEKTTKQKMNEYIYGYKKKTNKNGYLYTHWSFFISIAWMIKHCVKLIQRVTNLSHKSAITQ